ncbi:MAG: HIT family protein [Methylophaga sp.]|nr:MAG: HIT family protein [Methylophaga sp.]
MFELHPQLAEDTLRIGSFPLCEVLLMNDARYPWIILVPRKVEVSEIYHLDKLDQQQLTVESSLLSSRLLELVQADKMNVAALGNIVSQLHIHHVARFHSDETWPAPVWGRGQSRPYLTSAADDFVGQLTQALDHLLQS